MATCPDVAPECAATLIPPHEHHVRLVLIHSELRAAYGLRPGLSAMLRLPYDIKDQRVRYTTLTGEPYTPPYGDIHHRSETLTGLSDGSVMLQWEPPASGASHWHLEGGVTLPLGHIVDDPIALGRAGLKHEHLQFGSGVVAPQLQVGWRRAFGIIDGQANVEATIPLTSNREGFRPPKSLRWSGGPSWTVGGTTLGVAIAGQVQSIGRWHGEQDEGTGFINGGVQLQFGFPWRGMTIAPSVYRELYSHGLSDESFSQGTTTALTISRRF